MAQDTELWNVSGSCTFLRGSAEAPSRSFPLHTEQNLPHKAAGINVIMNEIYFEIGYVLIRLQNMTDMILREITQNSHKRCCYPSYTS